MVFLLHLRSCAFPPEHTGHCRLLVGACSGPCDLLNSSLTFFKNNCQSDLPAERKLCFIYFTCKNVIFGLPTGAQLQRTEAQTSTNLSFCVALCGAVCGWTILTFTSDFTGSRHLKVNDIFFLELSPWLFPLSWNCHLERS